MLKIIVLNDNRCDNENFKCEHGISLLIEYNGKKVLFDAGQTDIFIENAKKLNIDLTSLDAIVLSHGDYDHGNGLKYLDVNTDLICHPDFMLTRISRRTGNDNGLNQTREELQERFNLIETSKPYNVSDEIVFLGQIERNNDFEKGKNLPATDENGNIYPHFDDSGIAIKTKEGIIVISGCSHSGICNTVEYAKKVTGENRVLAVMGGFHLKEIDECTLKTIEYMKNNVQSVYLAHCTSDNVCQEFGRQIPGKTHIIKTGMTYEFEKERNFKER